MLFFLKSSPSFDKKGRSNMQVNWTTTESHRFSSTFKTTFVSMAPWALNFLDYSRIFFFILWQLPP